VRYAAGGAERDARAVRLIRRYASHLGGGDPAAGGDGDPAAGGGGGGGGTALVVCAETESYRRLAWSQARAGDAVLEVGSSFGEASAILARRASLTLGVDNSPALVAEAAARCAPAVAAGRLSFALLDALQDPEALHAAGRALGPGALLFVDIGGNRALPGLAALLPHAIAALRPPLVAVKSRALHAAVAAAWASAGAAADDDAAGGRRRRIAGELCDGGAFWRGLCGGDPG